jgi:integral membrane protein
MVKLFKYTAILEGISFLVLLVNMIFIKPTNFVLYKTLLNPIGYSHGFLFIGYCLLALVIKKSQNWDLKTLFIVLAASLLPLATFFVEKKYVRNV